jgi:death-on-curing protein
MPTYLTMDEIVMMHEILIQKFGGSAGIRDKGALEGAVYRPQSGYYNDRITEAAALFESLAINHPFVDGNKRIAFAAMDVFLRMNGYKLNTNSQDAYNFIIGMFEEQKLDVENITHWLKANIVKT